MKLDGEKLLEKLEDALVDLAKDKVLAVGEENYGLALVHQSCECIVKDLTLAIRAGYFTLDEGGL